MAQVLNTENWDLRNPRFSTQKLRLLRQKKLYEHLSISEHISKTSSSHWNAVVPSLEPPPADSQRAQAPRAGKRQASDKLQNNCLLHFVSENLILEGMEVVVKNSLCTNFKENTFFYSDCTPVPLALRPYRLRHAVLGAYKNDAQLQVPTWPHQGQAAFKSLFLVVKSQAIFLHSFIFRDTPLTRTLSHSSVAHISQSCINSERSHLVCRGHTYCPQLEHILPTHGLYQDPLTAGLQERNGDLWEGSRHSDPRYNLFAAVQPGNIFLQYKLKPESAAAEGRYSNTFLTISASHKWTEHRFYSFTFISSNRRSCSININNAQ